MVLFFHFFNCMAICFGPHVVLYRASQLQDNNGIISVVYAILSYLATTMIKLVLLASLPGNETLKTMIQAIVSVVDVAGLWMALTIFQHRKLPNSEKLLAVGIGWAGADSAVSRVLPIWFGCYADDFCYAYLQKALHSNAVLIHSVSFAALGTYLWSKRGRGARVGNIVVVVKLLMVIHALARFGVAYLDEIGFVGGFSSVVLDLFVSCLLGLTTYSLYVQGMGNVGKKEQ
eukprot:TRINITY_DN15757_c0_g1_i4.p2 TRINITY_DN15757_c0_g1~~TRINITY_DN15757_c0_g1_i4.p2  ORF type:complete len:231 (-),score=11.71 TRINITY_DN15757_c0_g1_i4:69-761(-)